MAGALKELVSMVFSRRHERSAVHWDCEPLLV
jgi:hypothetical protein